MARVLVVEDSRTQAEDVRLILESEGFEVETVPEGSAAMESLARRSFDVVVSDILMSGLSGYDLCRTIKSDPATRDMPVILLTTLNDAMDIIHGLECGADNFLTKPCAPDLLLRRIRRLLDNRQLRAAGKLNVGIEISFLGRRFTITSEKEQILDLLIATFEHTVRANRELTASQTELAAAMAKVEAYARLVEGRAETSEEKYRTLMEGVHDGVFIADPAGKVLEMNRQAEAMLGRRASEIVGTEAWSFVAPSAVDEVRRRVLGCLAEGSSRLHNVPFTDADRRQRWADLAASTVSLREGPLLLILASDVTERNQMEKQVQQAQRLEAIGRLAGGVAHDFNNLLTVITGYVDILLMALPERHAMGAEITEIRKAADRASALTRQLLAFGRRQIAVPKVLDLNAVLGEMDGLLRRLLGADVDLRTSLEPSLGRIQADPVQVEQIVMNLAVNAREAMPRGGALSIETRNVHLDEARARRQEDLPPGPYVALAVRDTGAGMDEETQAHVFEPFFTTKERGTGLGLATVYGIVKHGGGHVSVESAPGLGTTMRIYFPRVEAPPGPPEGTSSSSAPPGCETILLVEDDDNVRALAGRFLRDRGYRVLEACDEEGALRAAELEPGAVHLLVADVMIPGRSGPDLARRLCELRPDTKVLHVSGYADEALARLGVREDGAPLLRKPFTADSLCLKVREVLDGGSPPRPAPREEEERDPEPALRPIPGAG